MTFGKALGAIRSGQVVTRTYVESDTIVVVLCKYTNNKRLMRKKVTTKNQTDWSLSGWSLLDMKADDWLVAG